MLDFFAVAIGLDRLTNIAYADTGASNGTSRFPTSGTRGPTFAANLPLPPNSPGAGNYTLVFTFTSNLTSVASPSVSGTGTVMGNPMVSGHDVSGVQSHTCQSANGTNFRDDLDVNGVIDGNDLSTAQSHTRTELPSPP